MNIYQQIFPKEAAPMAFSRKHSSPALQQEIMFMARYQCGIGYKSLLRLCRRKGYHDPEQIIRLSQEEINRITQ